MAQKREYKIIDVVIKKSGEKYRARVINSPCGPASVEFDDPFSPFELENLVLHIGPLGTACAGLVTIWQIKNG